MFSDNLDEFILNVLQFGLAAFSETILPRCQNNARLVDWRRGAKTNGQCGNRRR